jgi:tetratricopeptide (TPR) repeat protein
MKYFKILLTYLTIFAIGHTLSCNKYLDKKSSNGTVTPTSLADLQGLLDDANNVMNRGVTPILGEASSDDFFILQSVYDSRKTTEQDFYIWKRTPYQFPNDWSKSYAPVFSANFSLEYLTKIERTAANSSAWDQVKGSAFFYRAYNFLNLLWNHSKAYDTETSKTDLGIALRLGADFNDPSQRSSVEEGYQRVIADTKAAIPLLPIKPTHPFRPSQWAAYALLARAYLSMRIYDSASHYASLALEISDSLIDFKGLSANSAKPIIEFNTETIFYTDMYTYVSTLGRGLIDTTLYSSYHDDDLRKVIYFRVNGNYYSFKGSYSITGFFSGLATDEIFLIQAECLARQGNTSGALASLNKLLKTRWNTKFTPLQAESSQEALVLILKERRKELIFRGLRWIDIKRLNKEGSGIDLKRYINSTEFILKANDDYFALPLPTDIIQQTSMPQNP